MTEEAWVPIAYAKDERVIAGEGKPKRNDGLLLRTVLKLSFSSIMLPVAYDSETAVETLTGSSERTTALALEATLWRCEKCSSLITIHSRRSVVLPVCPICIDSTIEFCAPMPSTLALQIANA